MEPVLGGPCREAQVAPLNQSFLRKQTVADKFHGFVINFIIRGLHQFGEHVNDKKFYFVRVQKAEQDWTDKGDHNQEGSVGQVMLVGNSDCAGTSRNAWR